MRTPTSKNSSRLELYANLLTLQHDVHEEIPLCYSADNPATKDKSAKQLSININTVCIFLESDKTSEKFIIVGLEFVLLYKLDNFMNFSTT